MIPQLPGSHTVCASPAMQVRTLHQNRAMPSCAFAPAPFLWLRSNLSSATGPSSLPSIIQCPRLINIDYLSASHRLCPSGGLAAAAAVLVVLVAVLVALVEKGPLADPRTYRRFSFITCKGTHTRWPHRVSASIAFNRCLLK